MSATTTQAPEAATPQWLLPVLSLASSTYLYVLLALAVVAAVPALAMGLDPHIISTGSMRTAINPGDLVLTVAPEDPGALGQGAVITYEHPAKPGRLVTHRIVEVLEAGGYRTQGDANNAVDAYVVQPGHIVGAGQLVVPMIGLPATWLRHGMWLEFVLFVVASVIAFAGATLRLGEDDGGDAEPQPRRSARVGIPQRASGWAQEQVAAVAALGAVVLTVGVVALERRTGALLTDPLLAAVESGAAPVGLWPAVAVVLVAAAGFLVVRVALPGGRWGDLRSLPEPVVTRLAWFERNGTLFVAVLSVFVMTGAATALATTASGSFTDAMDAGATMSADHMAPPTGLGATAGCDGYSPRVDLSWTESTTTDADGYDIRRGPSGSESFLASVLGLLTTTYEDTSVSSETTYSYEVVTTLGSWTSDPAGNPTVSVTTPDCSPPDMWISSLTGSSSPKDLTNWTATASAEVSTDSGVLSGATVSGRWDDLTGTLLGTSSCTTDAAGICSVSMDPLVTASEVTFTVTDVSDSGHEYVASENTASSVAVSAP